MQHSEPYMVSKHLQNSSSNWSALSMSALLIRGWQIRMQACTTTNSSNDHWEVHHEVQGINTCPVLPLICCHTRHSTIDLIWYSTNVYRNIGILYPLLQDLKSRFREKVQVFPYRHILHCAHKQVHNIYHGKSYGIIVGQF